MRCAAVMILLLTTVGAQESRPTAAPKRLALPHLQLALDVPPAWKIEQVGDRIRLSHGKSHLELRKTIDPPAPADLVRSAAVAALALDPALLKLDPLAWTVEGARAGTRFIRVAGERTHFFGALQLSPQQGLAVTAQVPTDAPDDLHLIQQALQSLDVSRFPDPRQYVDWSRNLTLTLPKGWRVTAVGQSAAAGEVPDLDFVLPESPGIRPRISTRFSDPEAFYKQLVTVGQTTFKRALAYQLEKSAPTAPKGSIWSTVTMRNERNEPAGRVRGVLLGKLAFWVAYRLNDRDASAALEMLESLRLGCHPGTQETTQRSRFSKHGLTTSFVLPAGWKEVPTTSNMRAAVYSLPGKEPLQCIVWFFGVGRGGTAAQNIERWGGQVATSQPPKTERVRISSALTATFLDAQGRYIAETRPGSNKHVNKPDYRLLGAVLEFEGGPLFTKIVGPQAAVAAHAKDFRAWVRSFRP